MSTDLTHALFSAMWDQYIAITPSAIKIHALLEGSDAIINDHVAYRTFAHTKTGLSTFAQHWQRLEFVVGGEYHFKQKKLYARHFQHPDPSVPKVFVSELLLDQCSDELQGIAHCLIDQLPSDWMDDPMHMVGGAPWTLTQADHQTLADESEYAGWLAALGYRANHFTVNVNALADYENLEAVVQALTDNGFSLNTSGGVIKGGAEVHLAQASTLADETTVAFADGEKTIPGCFYEFAERFPLPDGSLYQGFVEASADKIFESTDKQ